MMRKSLEDIRETSNIVNAIVDNFRPDLQAIICDKAILKELRPPGKAVQPTLPLPADAEIPLDQGRG